MKSLIAFFLLIAFLGSCTQAPQPDAKPLETSASTTLPFFENLEQHFTAQPIPSQLLDSLRNMTGWKPLGNATVYPLLYKDKGKTGFLSNAYGDTENLFIVRQKHASGGGGYYDILFSINPQTGKLIDQTIIGEEHYLTSLRFKTIWVDALNNYAFHSYGMGKIDSLTIEDCLEEEDESVCQHPVSKYIFVDDDWHFQTIVQHKIARGRLFPFLSNQFLESYALNHYSKATLTLMSAEINAQYGASFDTKDIQAHFDQQDWYQSKTVNNIETLFSVFEQHNLALINDKISTME